MSPGVIDVRYLDSHSLTKNIDIEWSIFSEVCISVFKSERCQYGVLRAESTALLLLTDHNVESS